MSFVLNFIFELQSVVWSTCVSVADRQVYLSDAMQLELEAAGVDIIQFDEPAFTVFHDEVQDWGVAALERAAEGLRAQTAVHICYGYGIEANNNWKATLGPEWRQYEQSFPLLQQSSIDIISLESIHSKVPLELVELIPSSNCGMAPLAWGAALDKLGALAAGAAIVRSELTGTAASAAS
ncbi:MULTISPECIES: hypothetical protein [unclassified Curtobacterium]|uniref:hypothetical protein n=1 Tax=unclassified Curtobacterium TaxID=257496 RepID=UPI0021AD4633|nr:MULTISPECIES: hypothetical protein [unclassified Curtobacterium]